MLADSFTLVGQGYCRESDCAGCNSTVKSKRLRQTCVDTLAECEDICKSTPGCKGIAYAATPPDLPGHISEEGVRCASKGRAR